MEQQRRAEVLDFPGEIRELVRAESEGSGERKWSGECGSERMQGGSLQEIKKNSGRKEKKTIVKDVFIWFCFHWKLGFVSEQGPFGIKDKERL